MTEAQSPMSTQETPEKPSELSQNKWPIIGLVVLILCGLIIYKPWNTPRKSLFTPPFALPNTGNQETFSLKTFTSDEEFQTYIQESQNSQGGFGVGAMARDLAMPAMMESSVDDIARSSAPNAGSLTTAQSAANPERVSETNVQVKGIDEPDIVKTNGKQLFVSTELWNYGGGRPVPFTRPMIDPAIMEDVVNPAPPEATTMEMRIAPGFPGYPTPQYQQPTTKVLSALPPSELKKLADIDVTGQLLLYKNTLIVMGNKNGESSLTAIDISNPVSPNKLWNMKINQDNQVVTARLKDDSLYLITQTYAARSCPVIPLYQTNGEKLTIACTDIAYPDRPVSNINTIYTAMIIDPQSGKVGKTQSIVGSSGQSIVYMSPESLYITFQTQPDMVKMMDGFVSEEAKDLFPQSVADRLSKLSSYDISSQAKMIELQLILENFQQSISKDDRLKLENELNNRMKTYLEAHGRELEQTMIVRLDADDLKAAATGQVPGYALNQFSLDEYEGNLRIATTFGQAWTQFGRPESASDVYVLDSALRQTGVVQDLGKGERIYSVRFLSDKGYVVTFKQTDPFYVLDLSNPSNPQKTGELKIPGYSSYLHALTKDKVLGIGKEDNKVKVSLFDVSNPADPREVSKYTLDEYWTEAENNHHAFLQDEKYQVFFMPGSKGGYVFSYKNDQLSLTTAISQQQVKRALFIDDYLFIVGETSVNVVNEKDWKVVKELSL